jgi:phage tail-like protein
MARSAVTDPIRNFKFQVEITPPSNSALNTIAGTELVNLGFSSVSGLTVQNEMIAYREGGMNTHPHKMVGQSDYGPVTFSKGVFAHQNGLYVWQQFLHSWGQGDIGANGGSTTGNNDYRCDIIVRIFDHPISSGSYALPGNSDAGNAPSTPAGGVKMAYKLHNCWPASFALGDLNAGDSSIMIQQLVINHEGFDVLWTDNPGGVVDESQFPS